MRGACVKHVSEEANALRKAHALLWKSHESTESWRLCPFSPSYNIDGSGVRECEEESQTDGVWADFSLLAANDFIIAGQSAQIPLSN